MVAMRQPQSSGFSREDYGPLPQAIDNDRVIFSSGHYSRMNRDTATLFGVRRTRTEHVWSAITAARSHDREMDHVPAYSHSNRWIRVGGTCSDERVVIGEIRGSQRNRNYRPGAVRLAQRSRNESVAAAGA